MKAKWLMKQIGATIWNNRSNIEFVAGNVMVAVGTGMIISKAEEAVKVKNDMQDAIKKIELKDEHDDWDSNAERNKACIKMATDTGIGYAKVYGPGLGVEIGGMILIGMSKATDRREIAVVSAALASKAAEFANYRKNVREELGDQKDEEFLLGKPEKIVTTDMETGETKEETKKPDKLPDHSFFMDETNPNYDSRGFSNLEFLEDHERWLNERLWQEGYLTENEIRKDVQAPADPRAEGYGITAVDENGNRNYISFGIQRDTERAKAFREGTEKSFLVILSNMEPNVMKKLYRLNKYHKDVRLA